MIVLSAANMRQITAAHNPGPEASNTPQGERFGAGPFPVGNEWESSPANVVDLELARSI